MSSKPSKNAGLRSEVTLVCLFSPNLWAICFCKPWRAIDSGIRTSIRTDSDGSSSELIGQLETTVGAIVGAPKSVLLQDIYNFKSKNSQGKIILKSEPVQDCNDVIFMKWLGIKLKNVDGWFGNWNPISCTFFTSAAEFSCSHNFAFYKLNRGYSDSPRHSRKW